MTAACGGGDDPHRAESSANQASTALATAARERIPDDLIFSTSDSQVRPGIKRSVDVRLSRAVTEDVIRDLAIVIRSADSRHYERTFISYYLPGMEIGAGAWAVSHFTPELEVRIQGLSVEERSSLANSSVDLAVEAQWLDETPFVGARVSLRRTSDRLVLRWDYADGSSRSVAVAERVLATGRRLDPIDGSATGDHWLITTSGDLESWDDDGLIRALAPID